MTSHTTLTLSHRSAIGQVETFDITISREVVLDSEVDYEVGQPPLYGWMGFDDKPLDYECIFGKEAPQP